MTLAAIFDCEGPRASADEKAFFREVDPWGFIVFARHCQSADELRAHCDELRDCVGREDAPILIDQEGGRVARMQPPTFAAHAPAAIFGDLNRLDPKRAREAARLNAYLLARMISDCGVNVNCVPMLDVPQPDANPAVIGDRAVAKHPDIIAELGREIAEGTLEGGALPVSKHLPGHGRALSDSHHELPRVSASKEDLRAYDFKPFQALNNIAIGMTAHVVYEAYDAERCATVSPLIIKEVIRGELDFDGLLLSDDLKMKALEGPIDARMKDSLEAGCDIGLCCNFSWDEKQEALKGARAMDAAAEARAARAMAQVQSPQRGAVDEAYEQLAKLTKPVMI